MEKKVILDDNQKRTFSKKVENYVKERGGSYIDAVLSLCEEYQIEPPVVAKSLSKPLIEKIQMEGQDLNLLPKPENKLPV
jgi:hypothetical protein|tara:strand:+ start:98 stop:337 length:240 start_codon:yes stop_codon:yes gene_type:complete